ncbi:hypothetical protein ACLQ2S_06040 [Micromonospora sp. DT48]|uniref:hypothetical protein n=1 Tax=unclassified Micromonospora TaxID=2617518 RepID=UPI0012BB71DD|nr:hypothetical protein [Micromonospora sp. CP22]MTK02860.1 hypothetical protein [Micromonospora sp. CP22]
MPSPAIARPLWPATLRALRELTRLALASLVLAVGLGAAVAADPAAPPATVPPPNAAVAVVPPAGPVATVRAAAQSGPAIDAGHQRREPARNAPTRPAGDAATTAGAAQVEHISAVRAGEPTRRGPPTG